MNSFKNRKSIRLTTYNYRQNGSYFITICIQNKEHRLGEVFEKKMILNDAGVMVNQWLDYLIEHFENIEINHRIIMPNHIHFILDIEYFNQNTATIAQMIQWFKTMTTNEYIRGVKNNTYPPFNKRIWQRNYYEHIIRNKNSFLKIEQYIQNNPSVWEKDVLYSKV